MAGAFRSARTFVGVAGVQYTTTVALRSPEEGVLQGIQGELADGVVWIGAEQPVPHLFMVDASVVGESRPRTFVGLWVPVEKQADAERLLRQAGYEVTDAA
jgi:hypothetical protein